MLVPGKEMGDSSNNGNICYWGIFQSYDGTESTWEVGTAFFENYYIVFDMTPYDQYDMNYIQIGIAPINKDLDLAKLRYDYTSLDYSPEEKIDDASYVIGGFKDQYDETPAKPDPIKPIHPDDVKNQTDAESKGNATANNGDIVPSDTPAGEWL